LLQYPLKWLCILWLLGQSIAHANDLPSLDIPNKLNGSHVLVLYKQDDSQSKQIAQYYAEQRHVPNSQLAAIDLPFKSKQLTSEQFSAIIQQLAPKLTDNIKVILLTWHTPYRVGCMSITSAFALGYDDKYCGQKPANTATCNPTAISPYYNDQTALLWQKDSPLRLSMMLSAKTLQQAKALINRGVSADNTYPKGHAYLVRTHDRARSTRTAIFKRFAELWQQSHNIHAHFIDDRDKKTDTSIKHKKDILYYQTGLKHVPDIDTNTYLPGAIADHLTSGAGSGIEQSGQMKAFRWLESGVTGSYGAVIEPCNFPEKFPNPQILIPSYVKGDSLIEAYWKSVQQPGEGLFIGEPLARPWSKTMMGYQGHTLVIKTQELDTENNYLIEQKNSPNEQWIDTPDGVTANSKDNYLEIRIPNGIAEHYRITQKPFYFGITTLPE
jgi:uncharacterized protein (TIGR03790 family)